MSAPSRSAPRSRSHLGEGFFAVNLADVRTAVATLPWVEHAEARKRWPDSIELVVYEQQPFARWGKDRLINRHGSVFSVAGVEGLQGLPELSGPDDRLEDVIQFHADCLQRILGQRPDRDGRCALAARRLDADACERRVDRGRPRAAARAVEAVPRCVAEARCGTRGCAVVCRSALCEWVCGALGRGCAGHAAVRSRGNRHTGIRPAQYRLRESQPAVPDSPYPVPGFPHMTRKPEKNLIVGLDVGTSKIVAIVGEHAPGEAGRDHRHRLASGARIEARCRRRHRIDRALDPARDRGSRIDGRLPDPLGVRVDRRQPYQG